MLSYRSLFAKTGTTTVHTELEEHVAKFVGKPAAIVFGMGYATNSAVLPVLIGEVHRVTIVSLGLTYHFYLASNLVIAGRFDY